MTIDTAQMLRQLAAGGAPPGVQASSGAAAAHRTNEGAFAELLKRARDGTLSSNRPVSVEKAAGLALSEEQLARLSLAADRAEAAGLRTALVLIDDQRLILDVHQRSIIGAATPEHGVLDGIDGVIDLANVLAPPPAPAPVGPPSALESPAVARLLAMRDEAKAVSEAESGT
ncbi:MAG: hypothetical protein KF699_09070 [Phycisphaeraceae bacterium]|nr:hypothetical protein [Phycisphaeraceae bacterium]MBX3406334.1 hypothetical protein [Phycisphaeraceae bacterium]